MNIALFDFDGTLSFKDSFIDFLRFCAGDEYGKKLFVLAPVLLGYKLGVISEQNVKNIALNACLGGVSKEKIEALCLKYSQFLPALLRARAKERLAWHKQNGDKIVIVSASLEEYLRPWCDENDFELIGSQLEISAKVGLKGLNCRGDEKVRRIKEKYDLSAFERIYAYGDTKGDLPMLALAHEKFYKPFRD